MTSHKEVHSADVKGHHSAEVSPGKGCPHAAELPNKDSSSAQPDYVNLNVNAHHNTGGADSDASQGASGGVSAASSAVKERAEHGRKKKTKVVSDGYNVLSHTGARHNEGAGPGGKPAHSYDHLQATDEYHHLAGVQGEERGRGEGAGGAKGSAVGGLGGGEKSDTLGSTPHLFYSLASAASPSSAGKTTDASLTAKNTAAKNTSSTSPVTADDSNKLPPASGTNGNKPSPAPKPQVPAKAKKPSATLDAAETDDYSLAKNVARPQGDIERRPANSANASQHEFKQTDSPSSPSDDGGQYYSLAQCGLGANSQALANAKTSQSPLEEESPSHIYLVAAQDGGGESDYRPTGEEDYYSVVQQGADESGAQDEYSLAQNDSNTNEQEYSLASNHQDNPKLKPAPKPKPKPSPKVGGQENQGIEGAREFSLAQHLMALNLQRAAAAAQEKAREASEDHHSYENIKNANSRQNSQPRAPESNDYTSMDSLNALGKVGACDGRASGDSQNGSGSVPGDGPEGSGPYYGNIPEYLSVRGEDEPMNGSGGEGDYNDGEGVYDHIDHNPYSNVD